MNFMATSLNPFCSNLLMMSPTRFLWTPSGLIMMKVRSLLGDMVAVEEGWRRWKVANKVVRLPVGVRRGTDFFL